MAEATRVGWREWVVLDQLDSARIKAKIDTGARSSSLHATGISVEDHDPALGPAPSDPPGGPPGSGAGTVTFTIHPHQHDDEVSVVARAPLAGWREVRSSNGALERRVAITTILRLGDDRLETELTLTRRDDMGFRMLLGRSSITGRYVVDPARSFIRSGRGHRHAR